MPMERLFVSSSLKALSSLVKRMQKLPPTRGLVSVLACFTDKNDISAAQGLSPSEIGSCRQALLVQHPSGRAEEHLGKEAFTLLPAEATNPLQGPAVRDHAYELYRLKQTARIHEVLVPRLELPETLLP